MANFRHQNNNNNSEWPRIASGQPGSIASKIYSRAHKASRRHYQRDGAKEDHTLKLGYERSRSADTDLGTDHGMRSDRRKKSKRRESDNTWTSQSPLTDRSSSGHRDDRGGHDNNHRHRSHSPAHLEPHHQNSHRSQQSEDSVTTNKYFAFHPSASPKRNRSSLQSQAWSNSSGSEEIVVREYNRKKGRVPDRILDDKLEAESPGDKDNNYNLWLWTGCVTLIALIILVTVIVLILFSVGDSSSSLTLGPGDNTPCVNYSVLSEYWRMIGRRPLAPGVGYNCDIFLEPGWYRFEGEAGVVLGDQTAPPTWEGCGTSRVVWLAGTHPGVDSGTVSVSYCVTGLNSNCDLRVSGQVRACHSQREAGTGDVFYVYRLVSVPTSCQWGYCAYSNYDGPS